MLAALAIVAGVLSFATVATVAPAPASATLPADWSPLATGVQNSCSLTTAGAVKCWGYGGYGALGNNVYNGETPTPVQAIGLTSGVVGIDAGDFFMCAVTSAGAAKCWGHNYRGQLGIGSIGGPTNDANGTPQQVVGLTTGVKAVSAGAEHACALMTGGSVKCWGAGTSGELGNVGGGTSLTPVDVQGVTGAVAISAGERSTCALISDGTVKCWGTNWIWQLGRTGTDSPVPSVVSGLANVTAISAGTTSYCALISGGTVKCWGRGDFGSLGNGTFTTQQASPVTVSGLSGVTSISSGGRHTCAITTSTAVKCWGSNNSGQLGNNGAGFNSSVPVDAIGLTGVTRVSAGGDYTCSLVGAAVKCWGSNGSYQLGILGTTAAQSIPTAATGTTGTTFSSSSPAIPTISGSATQAANGAGWYNTPVTVLFTCNSASGIASCNGFRLLSSEGAGQSTTGTAIDVFGQTATGSVTGINVDRTLPTGSGAPTSSPNGAGWYNGDVAVAWTCDDALSGVSSCPSTSTISGEGTGLIATGTVTDIAGNSNALTSPAVKIDRTKPSTSVSSIPTWSKTNVTVTFTPTDALSGVASTSYTVDGGSVQSGTSVVLSTEGTHTLTYYSTDVAGNVEPTNTATVRVDKTAPTISAATSPAPNGAGWSSTNPTVTFTCSDGTSGVASCSSPVTVTTETASQVVSGTGVDVAGNSSSTSATVKLDKTAPTISAATSPTANGNGWNKTDVTATFTCSDALSGIASCAAPFVFSSDGAGQTTAGMATDGAGNTASASATGVQIDKTAPVITAAVAGPSAGGGAFYAPATVTFTCSDALSGIAAGACPAPVTLTVPGAQTGDGTVTDKAGNSTVSSTPVTVVAPPSVTSGNPGAVTVGLPYTHSLTSSASQSRWSIASGTLPAGLSLNATTGQITGTATQGAVGSSTVTVKATSGYSSVSPNEHHTCSVLGANGVAHCFGTNYSDQAIDRAGPYKSVAAGSFSNCGILVSGSTADCWGYAGYGTGAGSAPAGAFSLVSGTSSFACGIVTSNKSVDCWGSNPDGQAVDQVGPFSRVSTGWYNTCGILSPSGAVKCWGANNFGQTVDQAAAYTDISASFNHTCGVLASNGSIHCWGDNGNLQSGDHTGPFTQVASAYYHTCGLLVSGGVDCWGANGSGQADDQVGPYTEIGAGAYASCGILATDGSIDCWGFNEKGQATDQTAPTPAQKVITFTTSLAIPAPTITGSRSPAANGNGWNNSPVTASFVCSSGSIASCSAPTTLSADGAEQSVTGTATDAYGVSTTDTVSGIKIDQVNPTGSVVAASPPNGAGWYRADVPLTWTCNDPLSGVSNCPTASIVGEGLSLTRSATVTDNAGNALPITSAAVKIDRTAPTTSVSAIPTWSKTNLTVTFTPSDNLSGVASTSYTVDGGASQSGTSATISSEGVHTLAYGSTDAAGNVEATQTATVRVDRTAPTISAQVSPTPNGAGWNKADASVTFTCSDGTSGVASCTSPVTVSTPTSSEVVSGTATDHADNSSSTSATVKLDKTDPTISSSVLPAANVNGWNNTDVTVTYTCNDNRSGVASCSPADTLSANESGQSSTGTSVDAAGNSASDTVAGIKIDKVAPTITASVSGTPNAGGYRAAPVTVTFTCTDALSGIASEACPEPVVLTSGGSHQVDGTVLDRAGNMALDSTTVLVNRAPIADDHTVSAPRRVATAIELTATDLDDEPLGFSIIDQPTKGAVSCTGASCSYTSAADKTGTDTFTFKANDAHQDSAPATVTIHLTNTVPVASPGTLSAPRNLERTVQLAGLDANSDALTYGVVDDAVKGDLACSTAGACTYTARPGTSGSDAFTFVANDAADDSAPQTVSITITNGAPTASAQTATAVVHVASAITVAATDPNSDPLSYSVDTPPTKGAVDCAISGLCTYTADGTAIGSDSFTFTANDGFGGNDTGTVSITITAPGPTISGDRTPAANANGWNNEPVVASFTCGSDALAACTAPVTVGSDGADQSVPGLAIDNYGQSATTTVTGISIDQVDPSIMGVAASPPNAQGWYKAPVEIGWSCDDALSGISAGVCPAASSTVGEGTAVSVSASVHDRAGNQASASSESVRVDLTAPSTGVSSPPTWSNSTVTLSLSASDALSGVAKTEYRVDGGADQTGTSPVVSGQGHHVVTYWSTDAAGNEEVHASVGVDIDTSAPSITSHVSPAANAHGWHTGSVEVTFTCDDTDSGVASCTGDESFSAEVDTVVTGHAEDRAGNTATDTATVRIDLSDPTVTAQVPPANVHGWFNDSVQVPFSCVDIGGSGVDVCPSPVVFAGEGADQAVTRVAVDNAGNEGTASGNTVSIDLTAPSISGAAVNGSNGSGGFYGNVTVHWSCDDALSGVVACPADEVVSGEGTHVVSASVNDRAGNTSTAELTLRIDHDPSTDPAIVHGRITNKTTGAPVAGVLVRLHLPDTSGFTLYSTTTGTDGTYTFPTVADGSYKLTATKWGEYLQAWYPNTTTAANAQAFTVAHGTNLTANQVLTPGFVLSGTLTAAASGAPISGATVLLSSGASVLTNAAGHYTITGITNQNVHTGGTFGVSFIAFGYTRLSTTVVIDADRTLDEGLATAAASTGIKGTITSLAPAGALAGATVRIWPKNAKTYAQTITSGANGRFNLPNLPVGDYEVDAVRPSYQVRWAADSPSRTGATTSALTTACTTTPDPTWGDVCATPINIQMRKP